MLSVGSVPAKAVFARPRKLDLKIFELWLGDSLNPRDLIMRIVKSLGAPVLGVLMATASVANAGPTCTTKPSSHWLSEAKMKAQISASGYVIDVFKTTKGNCYEIYGRTEDGRRVEVYYHPITGAVVKETVR